MEYSAPDISPASGLLNQRISMEHFDLIRMAPPDALKAVIEHYWAIAWDLCGKPDYCQENLPHPSVNLVIDPGGTSGIFGVQTGTFTYRLAGRGRLFGAKFRPGAFFDFFGKPVSLLRDRHVAISSVFEVYDEALEQEIETGSEFMEIGNLVEELILAKNVNPGPRARQARELVERIASDGDLVRLEQLSDASGLSVRGVQRLFESHVGVNPKWVIERYRMLAAVEALNDKDGESLTGLAHRLGYHDQAHFNARFNNITGKSPSTYKNVSSEL